MKPGPQVSIRHTPSELFAHYLTIWQKPGCNLKQLSLEIEGTIQPLVADVNAIIQVLGDEHIAHLGQNLEGAMTASEYNRAVDVYLKLHAKYATEFEKKGGAEKILQGLAVYLGQQCGQEDCLKDTHKRKYEEKDKSEIQMAKSALRALFDPAPKSTFGNYLHDPKKKISTSDGLVYLREMLAYYWLAASNPNMPLPPELESKRAQCIEEEKKIVLFTLADIRRAHNRQGDYRPLKHKTDEPSCLPGVVGRIGHMHVHSLDTFSEMKASPIKELQRKMQTFIIAHFKKLAGSEQFKVINAINFDIMNGTKEPNNSSLDDFVKALMQWEQCQEFLVQLKTEFKKDFDDNLEKLAVLYFVNASVKLIFRIEPDLHQRLESIAISALVEEQRDQTEDVLNKLPELQNLRNHLGEILLRLDNVKREMRALSQRQLTQIADYERVSAALKTLQAQYNEVMGLREKAITEINIIARKPLQERLVPFGKIYGENGQREEMVSKEEIDKITFSPYWLQKFNLQFEEKQAACKVQDVALFQKLQQFKLTNLTPKEMPKNVQPPKPTGLTSKFKSLILRDKEKTSSQTAPAPIPIPESPAMLFRPNLLNDNEIRYAEEHIMKHESHPEALSLQNYLAPGVLVKIINATTDPVIVSFTGFADCETKLLPIPLATMKTYAFKQYNRVCELAHPSDVLLMTLTEIDKITSESDRKSYFIVYFKQLSEAYLDDHPLYELALRRQTLVDLKLLVERLSAGNFTSPAVNLMIVNLELRIKREEVQQPEPDLETMLRVGDELSAYLQQKNYVNYSYRPKLPR